MASVQTQRHGGRAPEIIPAEAAGIEPPHTLGEVIEADPIVGAWAFDPETGVVYLVTRRVNPPAGEFEPAAGGTLTEWVDCDDDEDVYFAVARSTLEEKAEEFETTEDVGEAISAGRVLERAIPVSRLCPLVVELLQIPDGEVSR